MEFTFRSLRPPEAAAMYGLVQTRVAWMDEKGLRGWNANGYLDIFPLSYFEGCAARGECFGLWTADGRLAAAAVLNTADGGWDDDAPALYLHRLVSDPALPGAGSAMLDAAARYARQLGLSRLRLDAAADNDALHAYYAARGFRAAGPYRDGAYRGVRLEKRLESPQKCGSDSPPPSVPG